jgi:peroxiredoxin
MSHAHSAPAEASLQPEAGWHCSHFYYRFDRGILKGLAADELVVGRREVTTVLDPQADWALERLQVSVVSGHKADFGVMLMDPDPLKVDAVHQRLQSSALGPAIVPTYSFVSMTEISEYVPTLDQYADRLIREGESKGTPAFDAKLKAYESRLPAMNRQRLTPDFPTWPATCFYPMNKSRMVGANWFMLPLSDRNRLMAEHARSGRSFAGKVSQLITTAVGLEDWEWGVTLWGRNPQYLKEIVYRMRFDEASAKYAEFGPFYAGYITSVGEMLDHCRIGC